MTQQAQVLAPDTTKRPATWAGRDRFFARTLPVALLGGMLAYGLVKLAIMLQPGAAIGTDYAWVMGQAHRILEGGPFYQRWEFTNPILPGVFADLYPPPTVYLLFLPMSVLPAILWWIVPLGTIGAVLWHHRPSLWEWVVIAALAFVWPHTWTTIQIGNPSMWFAAAIALGTVSRPAFALVLLKPTLAPFALLGVRSRGWWIGVLLLAVVSLAMLPAWAEYVLVLRNVRFSPTYSFHDLALLFIPLVPVIPWRSE